MGPVMNQTKFPSLNGAVDGFVFREQDASEAIHVDKKALELASVDLISKLENMVSKAHQMPRVDFVDESGTIAREMLEQLNQFCGEFLMGEASAQANEEIDRALTFSHTFDEVLKTRSFANAVMRTFWKVAESQDIQQAHDKLGESLIRSCAATFYHAVMIMGLDTEFGREIDQSTVVFVKQLQEAWT